MSVKEKISNGLEQVVGGIQGMENPIVRELLKEGETAVIDKDGLERVCRWCGKTFKSLEMPYGGKRTHKQDCEHTYYITTCPECRKSHPFQYDGI